MEERSATGITTLVEADVFVTLRVKEFTLQSLGIISIRRIDDEKLFATIFLRVFAIVCTANGPLGDVVAVSCTTGELHVDFLCGIEVLGEFYLQVVSAFGNYIAFFGTPNAMPVSIGFTIDKHTIFEVATIATTQVILAVGAGHLAGIGDDLYMGNILGNLQFLFTLGYQILNLKNHGLLILVGFPVFDDLLSLGVVDLLEVPLRSTGSAVAVGPFPTYEEVVGTRAATVVVLVEIEEVISVLRSNTDVDPCVAIFVRDNGIDSHQVCGCRIHLNAGATTYILEATIVVHIDEVVGAIALVLNLPECTSLAFDDVGLVLLECLHITPEAPDLAVFLVSHHVLLTYLVFSDVVAFFVLTNNYGVDVLHSCLNAVVAAGEREGNLCSKNSLISIFASLDKLFGFSLGQLLQFFLRHLLEVDVQRLNGLLQFQNFSFAILTGLMANGEVVGLCIDNILVESFGKHVVGSFPLVDRLHRIDLEACKVEVCTVVVFGIRTALMLGVETQILEVTGVELVGGQRFGVARIRSEDVSELRASVLSGIRVIRTTNTPLGGVVVGCRTTGEHENNLIRQVLGVEHLYLEIVRAQFGADSVP